MRNENKETNQGKKAIGESMGSRIVLALIVVAVIVTAAKVIPLVRNRVQTSQYPVIELADLQGMELESLSDGKFSFSYPAEDWEVWEQVTTDYHPLTNFYKGTADDGSTSISVAENDTVVTQLKPELLQVMLDGLKEQAPYMVIKESEMRSMEGTPVFYLEDNMSLTQEGLDMMVEVLAMGSYKKVVEIPYKFQQRTEGESKLSGKVTMEYLKQLKDLRKRYNKSNKYEVEIWSTEKMMAE